VARARHGHGDARAHSARAAIRAAACALALACAAPAQATTDACVAPAAAIRLDHAIVVVHDLDKAADRLAPLGFRFKPGRPHLDGLLNRHIKFRDGTELELMTVVGTPGSRMAGDYASLLAAGEGGVYAALWTDDPDRVRSEATALGHVPRTTRSGLLQFIGFPEVADAAAVWVGAGSLAVKDSESVLAHENRADGLAAAWIEGGPDMERLLRSLGSRPCGPAALAGGLTGERWALARGSLVLVPPRTAATRRLLAVELRRAADVATPGWTAEPLPGFRIVVR
jgi:hypothetical protein